MDSTNPFNFPEMPPNPFDYNWNYFDDSIDKIFQLSQVENVLLDDLDSLTLPCTHGNEFLTEVGYHKCPIDDDFFTSCDIGSFYQVSPVVDEKPLSISILPINNNETTVTMEIHSPVLVENHHNSTSRKSMRGRKRSVPLQLEEIRKYFDLPITKAANKIGVGLTVLKKRCRELNIMRWPHRKIKSLESLINNVKEMGLDDEIVMLKKHKKLIEKLPDLELTDRTRKLRQACFKANYKKRRLLAEHSSLS